MLARSVDASSHGNIRLSKHSALGAASQLLRQGDVLVKRHGEGAADSHMVQSQECAPFEHHLRSAMTNIDPTLVLAWQTAHSIARNSPPPVHDRGGFRVDTHSEKETKRWVFPQPCDGLREIAHELVAPRHYLKLCGPDEELRSALPARWELQPANYFMIAAAAATTSDTRPLPKGYRMELHHAGPVARACIIAPDGELAASGCAAEAADVFIYDRIETVPDHRRKGLGLALMTALGAARKSLASPQLLVATGDGRNLYTRLGWEVLAPFATATIPESWTRQ